MASETTRPFFIVFSTRTLENLSSLINSYYKEFEGGDVHEFSLLVPDKFKGEQTNRTVVVLDEAVFKLMKNDEKHLDNFQIQRLQLKKHFYPNEERAETPNFYIKLPKNLSLTKCQSHLLERMTSLRKLGLWEKNDYHVKFPNMDRLQDKHSGTAYIYFKDTKLAEDGTIDDVVLSRIYINNTKWPETSQEVHCFWARKHKEVPTATESETDPGSAPSTPSISERLPEVKIKSIWDEKNGKHK